MQTTLVWMCACTHTILNYAQTLYLTVSDFDIIVIYSYTIKQKIWFCSSGFCLVSAALASYLIV